MWNWCGSITRVKVGRDVQSSSAVKRDHHSAEIGKIPIWGRVLCISAGHISSGHVMDALFVRKLRRWLGEGGWDASGTSF